MLCCIVLALVGVAQSGSQSGALECTVECAVQRTVQYTVHSWSQSQLCGLESNNRAVDADQPTVTDTPPHSTMYPKDTSSEDPGPPPASEGGAGGVQTESGMRRSLFGQTQTQPSGSSTSLSEGSGSDNPNNVNITVAPFTGGPFQVKISKMETVEELKKLIARRLKVSKERIYLLYRER